MQHPLVYANRPVRLLILTGILVLAGSCSQGRGPNADGATQVGPDGGGEGRDGGGPGGPDGPVTSGDGGNMLGIPCTPGSYRCGAGNSVEICNSSGTAWLYSATCAVSCAGGLCTGACSPGQKRCNMNKVEQCNMAGTTWMVAETCMTYCDSGQCALPGLEITTNKSMDGNVLVAGDIIVRSGATLTSPAGDLTLRGKTITVENGASIAAAPTGQTFDGQGSDQYGQYYRGGGGGGYGSNGLPDQTNTVSGGSSYGYTSNATVQQGAKGGNGYPMYGGTGGLGGGALRLIADSDINIAGQVTANGAPGGNASNLSYGGGGGGSGGGVLVAAGGKIQVAGSVAATGGGGGSGQYKGGQGGDGRVKVLAGGTITVTGTLAGAQTMGILPPLLITSSSHPDPTLTYNDDFPSVTFSWVRPFASRQGYYQLLSSQPNQVPTPASGSFVAMAESSMFMPTALQSGDNYFHLASVDAMSNVGQVENGFHIRINSTPPSVTSMSHPNQTTWTDNANPFFQWTFPVDEKNVKGVYYVFDNFGDTIPTAAATFIPVSQKQLLRSGVADGIWVLHVVPVDQRDYLTRTAAHYRVQIGKDPGSGTVLGQVVDGMGKQVNGATVTVNRGLFSSNTNTTGNYHIDSVSAGSWELRVSLSGHLPVTQMIMVKPGESTTVNLTLP